MLRGRSIRFASRKRKSPLFEVAIHHRCCRSVVWRFRAAKMLRKCAIRIVTGVAPDTDLVANISDKQAPGSSVKVNEWDEIQLITTRTHRLRDRKPGMQDLCARYLAPAFYLVG